jgi:hypothetical protein
MFLDEYIEFEIKCGGKDGDHPILVLRRPTEKELSEFLDARFSREGRTVSIKPSEARVAFIDSLLVDCKRIEVKGPDQKRVPLTPERSDWKGRIPANWKTTICIKAFEEEVVVTPEEEKK